MIHFSDEDVERALAGADLEAALRAAFVEVGEGAGAQQERLRTEAGGVKLSTLGAVLPASGFAGAKIYTTIAGRFNFVIVLFDAKSGEALATFDANAITRRRTAAVSVIAARAFAAGGPMHLAIFGTGTQARSHLEAFARAFTLESVRIVSRGDGREMLAHAERVAKCRAEKMDARPALADARLVITATRSLAPLFNGAWVAPGAFVAAVGSTRTDAREIDDALIGRARAIVVEWREQAMREAGDLVLADRSFVSQVPIVELHEVLRTAHPPLRNNGDVVIFKSVGVGLEDVAAAGLAWQRRNR